MRELHPGFKAIELTWSLEMFFFEVSPTHAATTRQRDAAFQPFGLPLSAGKIIEGSAPLLSTLARTDQRIPLGLEGCSQQDLHEIRKTPSLQKDK